MRAGSGSAGILPASFGILPKVCFCGFILALASCGTLEFYSQATVGQLEMLTKRQPIGKVAAETPDPRLRERLALTRRLLDFAEQEMKMPSEGAYELYAELGREHLVWVVHAAPELSMEPKRWWYPVVGCQAYRGYFREDLARAEAARLGEQGYETWIGGVDAFSTLGWFRDPVLDTFVHRAEVDYAELIFHELVHIKYYIPGTTAENEALAEAVAREGVRRWFRHTGRPGLARRYDERLARIAQAREAIVEASGRLRMVYAADRPDEWKRARKREELARLNRDLRALRAEWGRGLKSWIEEPVNNARLNSFTTYEAGIPRFTRMLGDCDGDFERFWEVVGAGS
ncbi:aminopeptidase [Haloferula sp. A504]|uniref:aminopeptidase n=1 Tax=Haloferula sp. A504 TaxID=3373601 RepID=UPI0031C55002|nr:aminopeptidase [Verrucomicrobiaceae bacterium E54]